MRAVLFFLFALIIVTEGRAQDFDDLLGKPPDTVIFLQNIIVNASNHEMQTKLVSAKAYLTGGFSLTYRNRYFDNNSYTYYWGTYLFDGDNKLVSISSIFPATDELEQINQLIKSGFYEINNHLFYHKMHNVKVAIHNLSFGKQDQAIFLYSRKEYDEHN